MKKVIDGKVYNTNTAQDFACDGQSTLYLTGTGAFFLAQIEALTSAEAARWVETHGGASAITPAVLQVLMDPEIE